MARQELEATGRKCDEQHKAGARAESGAARLNVVTNLEFSIMGFKGKKIK